MNIDEERLMFVLRLAEAAARHACDHPDQLHKHGAKRGCGACRALVAILL